MLLDYTGAILFFRDTDPPNFLERDSPRCSLALNCHTSSEGVQCQVLTKFLKAIPSESITHVNTCGEAALGKVPWIAALRLLPALETVYLQVNVDAVNCAHALCRIEKMDPQRRTFPCIQRLHTRIPRSEAGNDTIIVLLSALEEYLQLCRTSANLLQVLEFEDKNHLLGVKEKRLERLFLLMEGEILCDGVVYDPIKRMEQQAQWDARRWALVVEFGIQI
ncbi:hypothetical protein B0H13DRAFT_2342424 [Mycena leptocephala]|nr:hypothetical protein B0H13DRAFT_2342424 [Mycena leptocephala]